jgi:hypothetical protein
VLAALIGVVAAAAAQACRAGRLGPVATLAITGVAAAVTTFAAGRLLPDVFLGAHGRWAVRQVEQMFRRGRAHSAALGEAADGLAVEKASPK